MKESRREGRPGMEKQGNGIPTTQLVLFENQIKEQIEISNRIATDRAQLAFVKSEFKESIKEISEGEDIVLEVGPYLVKCKWIDRKGFEVEDCTYARVSVRAKEV